MRIATFNIWNSNRGMPLREGQIIKEIKSLEADIICLQEVNTMVYGKLFREMDECKFSYYHCSDNEYEGLVVFSRSPILTKKNLNCAILITCEYDGSIFLFVNVHLPWDSIILKEQYIVDIIKEVNCIDSDYAVLTGDFNCSESSSVHHYLTGERTLMNTEANPYWDDMAEVYADITNTKLENTLDLRTNPRWKGRDIACKSERIDRIYVRDAFPKPSPQLKSFSLFGKEIDEQSGYCASDHYGVIAEIVYENMESLS